MDTIQKSAKMLLAPVPPLSENHAVYTPRNPYLLSIRSKLPRKSVFRRIDTLENFGYKEPTERYSTFSPDFIKYRKDASRRGNVMSIVELWGTN